MNDKVDPLLIATDRRPLPRVLEIIHPSRGVIFVETVRSGAAPQRVAICFLRLGQIVQLKDLGQSGPAILHPAGVRLCSHPFLQICHPAGVYDHRNTTLGQYRILVGQTDELAGLHSFSD